MKVILEEKQIRNASGKVIGTQRIEVWTEVLWEGWKTIDGVTVAGLKTLAKADRIPKLKEWGYKDKHIVKLRDTGLDI